MTTDANPTPSGSTLAVTSALAIAPQVIGLFNPLAGAIVGIAAKQWAAYLAARSLPADYEPSAEEIAAFEAEVEASSAAAIHVAAEARIAAEKASPQPQPENAV